MNIICFIIGFINILWVMYNGYFVPPTMEVISHMIVNGTVGITCLIFGIIDTINKN